MLVRFFDLEADNLLEGATQVWCGVFKDKDSGEVFKFKPNDIKDMLRFMDGCDVLIGHNIIDYDFPLLRKLFGYEFKGKKVDSLIMSRLLNPKRLAPINCPNKMSPHSIESWGYRVGRGKPDHTDWSKFSEEMLHRCTEDVEILALTYKELLNEAKGGKWRDAFLLTFELFENLHKQSQHGWLVDRKHMETCIRQLTKWIERIDSVIVPKLPLILEIEETKKAGEYNYIQKPFLKSGEYSKSVVDWCASVNYDIGSKPVLGCFSRINFRRTDLNSNLETKQYLIESGWEPSEWNTNDAGERTSPKMSKDDPFEGIDGKVGKLVAKRVQCRQRRSIIEGLIQLIRPDGRIASVVNMLAVTGRATHRNIVNIPKPGSFFGKQMRRIFTSAEGFVLVGTDSAGNQLRQLAARMNNPVYTEALINGRKEDGTDNHSMTMKAGELESRDIAKNTIYCMIFGGGDPKLAKTAKKPAGTGKALREKLYQGLDGLGELVERLTVEWKATARQRYNPKFNRMEYFDGVITGLDGRPIKVPYEHQLLVYLLQSDEAIQMAKAYNIVCSKLSAKYTWGVDYGIVGWIHDEIQIECREEMAKEVGGMCCDAIREAGEFFKIKCPHAGEFSIGKTWADTH